MKKCRHMFSTANVTRELSQSLHESMKRDLKGLRKETKHHESVLRPLGKLLPFYYSLITVGHHELETTSLTRPLITIKHSHLIYSLQHSHQKTTNPYFFVFTFPVFVCHCLKYNNKSVSQAQVNQT